MDYTNYNSNKISRFENHPLFARRQYFLGPTAINRLHRWKQLRITDDLILTHHPDLNVHSISANSSMLVLLGVIIDPFHPELDNDEILLNLSKSNSFEEIIENTYSLGGRWIIIYKNSDQIKLFHDATGHRQIFYTHSDEKIWCSSQPHLLARYLQIPTINNAEIHGFMNSDYERSEHAWIGDETFFEGIYHLLPNHLLDINENKSVRYWPNCHFTMENVPIEQAVNTASDILQGTLTCISLRYPMALAVTAGWDSRVLLAASKNIKDNIFYFVQEFSSNKRSNDIKIPNKLFKLLGIKFHVEKCEKLIKDEEFQNLFYENVAINQSDIKKELHYNFYTKLSNKTFVSGNASGITKNFYGLDHNPNATLFAKYFGREGDKYTIKKINEWLFEAKIIAENSKIKIMDLFYWEQRMGNWGAMFSADLDIAIEEICPFNNRKLLITLLSVNEEYRLTNNIFYTALINKMWPEVLKVPINPIKFTTRFKRKINKFRHFFGLL